jgi:hypothetical protein
MDICSVKYDICESTSYTYGLNHVTEFPYFFLLQLAITTTYFWLRKVTTTENTALRRILITTTTFVALDCCYGALHVVAITYHHDPLAC